MQTRRCFLESALKASGLLALAPAAPPLLCRAALAAGARRPGDDRTALVVVQLSGGNDGLNCVVPYADDAYARRRPTLRLSSREVLKLDDRLGLHPAMTECRRLFDDGVFSIIQGVGYPQSRREHPQADRDWSTARPGDAACETGWVGRFADHACADHPGAAPAALVATLSRPPALVAEHALIPAIRSSEEATVLAARGDSSQAEAHDELAAVSRAGGGPLMDLVAASASAAARHGRAIRDAAARGGAGYPDSYLAQRLRTIAALIRADAGFRIFYTELGGDGFGGFDNHAFQKDHHASLLKHFSGAVGAFLDDLRRDGLAERVTLMTVSEFGRTVTENGRQGTNHGAAAPVFLAGGALKGGLVGAHPSLDDLDNDALKFHTDFRQVYASMLGPWLGGDPAAVLGGAFDPVAVFKA